MVGHEGLDRLKAPVRRALCAGLVVLVTLGVPLPSWGGKFYKRSVGGVPYYTNIPPARGPYKVVWPRGKPHPHPPLPSLGHTYPDRYDEIIARTARWYGVDPNLVKAIIKVESDFNPRAVSPMGAMGVMQLMPQTARANGVNDPFDPEDNILGGVRYLSRLMERFRGDLELVLGAYNAGEGAVERYGNRLPPYPETREYVRKVIEHYNYLKRHSKFKI